MFTPFMPNLTREQAEAKANGMAEAPADTPDAREMAELRRQLQTMQRQIDTLTRQAPEKVPEKPPESK